MKTELFDYNLPKELIAQVPTEKRDESHLMVLHKDSGEILHKKFYEIIDFLNAGDVLVFNNTKVIPARIFGKDAPSPIPLPIGARNNKIVGIKRNREILLISQIAPLTWEVFIKPQRGLNIGEELGFPDLIKAKVDSRTEDGTYILKFSNEPDLSKIGYMPLPPYIKRDYKKIEPLTFTSPQRGEGIKKNKVNTSPSSFPLTPPSPQRIEGEKEDFGQNIHDHDKQRYQTVYAKNPGAIAAPTAGMHFTEELLNSLNKKGIILAPITLHVGIGTFRPVRVDNIEEHNMHSEWFSIPSETTEIIKNAKKDKRRIIAIGTTTTRAIETSIEGTGYTNIFIYPPYQFKIIDGLITNFHLPKSTLLMLVSAFAGRDLIMKAYEEAVRNRYRFFSYGDGMLII